MLCDKIFSSKICFSKIKRKTNINVSKDENIVILNLENVNKNLNFDSDENFEKNYLIGCSTISFKCNNSECGCSSFDFYGTYDRHVIKTTNHSFSCKNLNIQRIICKGCGTTHAIIPTGLIPYKIYSEQTCLNILICYFSIGFNKTLELYNIPKSTLLYIINSFKKYYGFIYVLYKTRTMKDAFSSYLKNIINARFKIFESSGKIFLQTHKGIVIWLFFVPT